MASGMSGSTIKSWFQYRCERKTRYEIMDPSELAAIPVSEDQREQSWAKLGVDYEDRVVARLAREAALLKPAKGDQSLPERQADGFLRGEGSAHYAAQVGLKPSKHPSFVREGIAIRRSFADLIQRSRNADGIIFRVIDIKATRLATAFHKTQVAFYVLLLRAMLIERGIDAQIDPVGAIWRIPDDGDVEGDEWQIDEFALAPYIRLVEEFCDRTLPTIAGKQVTPERDDTFFHVYFKCEQCKYLPHCNGSVSSARPPQYRDISAVAGLSHEAKRTLVQNGIRSVKTLADLGSGIGKLDGAGWSLSRRAEQLVNRAQSLRDNRVMPGAEAHTFLMPPRIDAAMYLLADYDPVDDSLVTLGYRYAGPEGVRDVIEILDDSNRNAEADALVTIFGRLIRDLEAIDAHNRAITDPSDPKNRHAHIFLYEPTEGIALQDAVKRHLDDPRVRSGLLHMVRLFPPEEVVPEPEFRGMAHLPATAVRSVVEQLFAVPATVSYDLRQVSQALEDAKLIKTSYRPGENFARPFSSLLSLDVIRAFRAKRGSASATNDIRADVVDRLSATQATVDWLLSEHARRINAGQPPMLRLSKQPFRLQATFNPLAAGDLDILRAFELLENRSGLLANLIQLAQPTRVRRDAGRSIGPMKLIGVTEKGRDAYLRFTISRDSEDSEIGSGSFGLILSDGEPDHVLEPRLWSRLACDVLEPAAGDDGRLLRIRMLRSNFKSNVFQEAKRRAGQGGWWLDQRFIDLNSSKAETFLNFLSLAPLP
jgi:predicted RecB family nuclease